MLKVFIDARHRQQRPGYMGVKAADWQGEGYKHKPCVVTLQSCCMSGFAFMMESRM